MNESIFASRRRKVLREIKGEAALFPASPTKVLNRDVDVPFRQDSDFSYLTGIEESEAALLLLGTSSGPRTILFLRERNLDKEVWEGERIGLRRAKRRFEIDEVRSILELEDSLPKLLKHTHTLNYPLGVHPQMDNFIFELLRTTVGPRHDFPQTLRDSRLMTSEMRFIKDRKEIQAIRHAVDITAHGILDLMHRRKEITSEIHASKILEAQFSRLGAKRTSFPTIIASGKNATCLHHSPTFQPLWKRDLVLVDAGAEYKGYAGDISRTFPASGKFSKEQAAVYDVVHAAVIAATEKARPGSTLAHLHQTAVLELTKGLRDLGILRGNLRTLVRSEKYKPFFMHRTSHWLGLDVHDIAPLGVIKKNKITSAHNRPLVPGNVFTIEPGLYFHPQDQRVTAKFRGIGVRLEEDVLITTTGCSVLSKSVPIARAEIEKILAD